MALPESGNKHCTRRLWRVIKPIEGRCRGRCFYCATGVERTMLLAATTFFVLLACQVDGLVMLRLPPFIRKHHQEQLPLKFFRGLQAASNGKRGQVTLFARPRYVDDDFDDDDFDSGLLQRTAPSKIPVGQQRKNPSDTISSSSSSSSSSEAVKSHFFSQKSLDDASFRLHDNGATSSPNTKSTTSTFAQLCRQAGIQRPSKIQSMAWPILIKEQQKAVILADQTGSGKTLAYLIPLLQRVVAVKDRRQNRPSRPFNSTNTNTVATAAAATPRLLILAPTAELADQIQAVCQKLSKSASSDDKSSLFTTVVLTASGQYATNIRDQMRMLQQKKSVDVLISTPGRMATILRTKHVQERVLDLRHLQMVVLDEVDVLLLDDTFGPQLQTIGEATTASMDVETVEASMATSTTTTSTSSSSDSNTAQFVFVTATLPDTVVAQVQGQFPDQTLVIKGPGLHRVAPTVRERLIDVSVPSALNRDEAACFDAKASALQQALRQNRCKRTLIFCNTVSTCRDVENLLNRQDRQHSIYTVRAYHNAMTAESRNENLDFFARAGAYSSSSRSSISSTRRDGGGSGGGTTTTTSTSAGSSSSSNDSTSYILVCTDRAARGVDFAEAAVDHVIIFDFPVDPAEYVRRVGRTARAGRDGASTVLAYGWQLPIARSVMGQQLLKDTSGSASPSSNRAASVEDDNDSEYMGGVKGRRASSTKRTASSKGKSSADLRDSIIGGNIAKGKLWNDKAE